VKRGDVVVAAERGRLTSKPRPWLVVQSDIFNDHHSSFTAALITSQISNSPLFRIEVTPNADNGLTENSVVQTDKLATLSRDSISHRIGSLDLSLMDKVDEAMRLWLQL
jgi:mRNA interferase MazF